MQPLLVRILFRRQLDNVHVLPGGLDVSAGLDGRGCVRAAVFVPSGLVQQRPRAHACVVQRVQPWVVCVSRGVYLRLVPAVVYIAAWRHGPVFMRAALCVPSGNV